MTRPKDQLAAEKEARLQDAITVVLNGEKTQYRAIFDFNVPKRTLYDRLDGKLPRAKAHERDQLLINAEEKELVR